MSNMRKEEYGGGKRGARASRARCLASRQTHPRPIPIAHGDHLRFNMSKPNCRKQRGCAAGDAPHHAGDGRAPNSSFCHPSIGLRVVPQSNQSNRSNWGSAESPLTGIICKGFCMNDMRNKSPSMRSGWVRLSQTSLVGVQCDFSCVFAFNLGSKNQGESRWLKLNQGESRHFGTFFYAKSNRRERLDYD